jgi:AcrR family transcriptional regulator
MDPTAELRERDALLGRISGYIEQHGLADFSLETVAAALGVDGQGLREFFPTRTELIVALIARNRIVLRKKFVELDGATKSVAAFRRAMWEFYVETAAASRLFFEVYGLALTDEHYGEFLHGVNDWLGMLKESLLRRGTPSDQAESLATLTLAVYRGAMMDLLATGERARVNAAMELWFTSGNSGLEE